MQLKIVKVHGRSCSPYFNIDLINSSTEFKIGQDKWFNDIFYNLIQSNALHLSCRSGGSGKFFLIEYVHCSCCSHFIDILFALHINIVIVYIVWHTLKYYYRYSNACHTLYISLY